MLSFVHPKQTPSPAPEPAHDPIDDSLPILYKAKLVLQEDVKPTIFKRQQVYISKISWITRFYFYNPFFNNLFSPYSISKIFILLNQYQIGLMIVKIMLIKI